MQEVINRLLTYNALYQNNLDVDLDLMHKFGFGSLLITGSGWECGYRWARVRLCKTKNYERYLACEGVEDWCDMHKL